ncbi:MAG: hypothetical protein QOJ00_1414 [Actinomycetota bacterium]
MNQLLVCVRHGETAWTLSGQHTGSTDVPLNDAGRDQARRLGASLTATNFEFVLSSPLARARETAELAGFPNAQSCGDLAEWDYGSFEGLTTDQIRATSPGWTLWADGVPGGETAANVGARADGVIAQVRAARGPALVFSHGHFLRVLAARWVGLAPTSGAVLALAPASVSVLGWEREQPVLQRWNIVEA